MRPHRASTLPLLVAASLALLAGSPARADRSKPRSSSRAASREETPAPARVAAQEAASLDVPFTKHVLANGLTLVVHEDHDAPIVAVNVWYHVGSKNERPGKTGFAHLFEHLMFQGSENHVGEWFQPFENVGATEQNGTTNNDRTNYFENVPVTALDMTLWLESDRMGHLLGAIDQAKLDEQRGVVQNEKRQGENQPYGLAWSVLARSSYPEGHPYSWTVIGSMDDLDAAKLDDVKEWFRTYYGPNNAVLVVAGDVVPADVIAKVEKYFGDIPPGPPLQRPTEWIAPMTDSRRQVMQDRVPQARLTRLWNVPGWGTADSDYLGLAADVLASGKGSRLWKRLVYDEQIATDVSSYAYAREIGGQFGVQVTAKPGVGLDRIEAIVSEEIAKLIEEGPTPQELRRVQAVNRAAFLKSLERVGGFGGKSSLLAESQVFGGSPDAWKESWERGQSATPSDVHGAVARWLRNGHLTLSVVPFEKASAAPAGADRSSVPVAGAPPAPRFPEMKRTELANGLDVILVENHSLPRVEVQLLVDAGSSADQARPGIASLTLDMLDEGAAGLGSLEIAEKLDELGATLQAATNLDVSTLSLSALTDSLDETMGLFADVVLRPDFPQAELARLKAQRLAAIAREKSDPTNAGLRVLPRLLYGEGHAYSNPISGLGTEGAIGALSREDLAAFHHEWFRPGGSTLILVGDVTMDEMKPRLERLFASWETGDVPSKNLADVQVPSKPSAYLIDRPGSVQSVILAGHVAPPKSAKDDLALEAMNRVFGGTFTSRLNMNLREDKAWSYGTRSSMSGTRGPRPFYVAAPVQSDKTKEAASEILKEMTELRTTRPITAAELQKSKDVATLTLPGRWETMSAVAQSIADIVRFGLPDRYWDSYPSDVRALTPQALQSAAQAHLHPEGMTWLIVGDRAKIEPGLRELFGSVTVLDADGRPAGGPGIGQ